MENPRPEKAAVVDEVRKRLSDSDAALLTEYRGINVAEMAVLRRALRAAGGDYKIYKNTLVRFAARDLGLELDELLTGPTAIAFVSTEAGGDPVTVAKALRDFAKNNPNLVVKGGVLGDRLLSAAEAKALAEVAPREELLARFAGGLAAPMVQFAGLLQALPRNFAYGLAALIEQGGAPGAPAPAATEPIEITDEASAESHVADEASAESSDAAPTEDAVTPEPAAAAATAPAASAADEPTADAAADTDTAAEAADSATEES